MKKFIKAVLPNYLLKRIYSYKKYILYSGDNVECPICKSKFRIFKSYGFIPRQNALCHNCGSLERHRLLHLYFQQLTIPDKILHFAPEKFFYKQFSSQNYTAVDYLPQGFIAQGMLDVKFANITNLNFGDNSFDMIICNHVLEHINDDRRAMKELFRVLRPKGIAILQVPIDYSRKETYEDFSFTSPEDKLREFGHPDHVRWYGRDYPNRLNSVGFKVIEDKFIESFSNQEKFRYGLTSGEIIYKCQKE